MKNRLIKLQLVHDIVVGLGHFIEFNLYKKAYDKSLKYGDAENVSIILSFITNKKVLPEELIRSKDEQSNMLLDSFLNLKNSYSILKKYGITKLQATKLFRKLQKTLLKLPDYYLSIPHNCEYLKYYILNLIDKETLIDNFILLNITGKHEKMNRLVFYKLYSNVLEELYIIKK